MSQQKLYVLDCEGGRKYVGLTRDLDARWAAHSSGRGAEWTKRYAPVCISSERDVPEETAQQEEQRVTAELMLRHGVNKVRGANLSSRYCYDESDKPVIAGTVRKALELDYGQAKGLVDEMFEADRAEKEREVPGYQCDEFGDVDALAEITGKMRIGEGSYREWDLYEQGDGESDGGGTQDGECGEPDFLNDDRFSRDGDFLEGEPSDEGIVSDDVMYSSDGAHVSEDGQDVDDDGFPNEEGSTSSDGFPEGSVGDDDPLDIGSSSDRKGIPNDSAFPEGDDSPDDDGFPVDVVGSDGGASSAEEIESNVGTDLGYEMHEERYEYEAHDEVNEHEEKYVHEEFNYDGGSGEGDHDVPHHDGSDDENAHDDSGGPPEEGNASEDSATLDEAPVSDDEGYNSDGSAGGGDDPDDQFSDADLYSDDVSYSDDGL